MFTDMVGYSALSQRNEALALELLEEHREVLRSVFPRHQGNEIKSTGDGFLVEFASALAAVNCAMEIQGLMRHRNATRSAERRVLIRIGIHLGDVVCRDGDVFGDGVNIAARIEPLAEPGGVCVSRAVYEQIENKVDHALVPLSRPSLKNIHATVEVYRLVLDEPRKDPRRSRQASGPVRRWRAVGLVLAAAAGVLALLTFREAGPRSPTEAGSGFPPGVTPGAGAAIAPSLLRADVRILHAFGPTNRDGVNGWGPLTLSRDGFLYGTAVNRGPGGGGVVFRLGVPGEGYRILRALDPARDGGEPTGGVIEGSDGWLYGTAFRGGAAGAGTVFRMARDGGAFQVLHAFAPTNGCRHPQSELLGGPDGWIYGTTTGGGGHGRGGIFRIGRDGDGYAVVTGLWRGREEDPRHPVGGLLLDAQGVLYGTTRKGGTKDNGTVFRLDPGGALTVVKSLGVVPGDLMHPEGTLVDGDDGFLYGTALLGGTAGNGGVFRVRPDGSGFEILHHCGSVVDDAKQPAVGLTRLPGGSFLGASLAGGTANLGAIFWMDSGGGGYRILHHFTGGPLDGARARSRLTPGARNIFFGATLNGGDGNLGTVFSVSTGPGGPVSGGP